MLLRLFKCCFRFFIYFVIIFLVLPFIPMPFDFEPVAYNVTLPEFKGALAPNKLLDKVEYLHPNQLVGPESLAEHKGSIYTGILGGHIVKITGNKVTSVAMFGKKCEGPWEEGICGRPLGLRFDKEGKLYAIDAYSGIHVVDVTKGFITPLVPTGIDIEGHPLKLPNDLVLDAEGNVYFTESSTRWPLNKIIFSLLEHDSSGRVLKYDAKTKRTEVLLEDLYLPNGIEMGPDGDSLIIAELGKRRLLRYYFRGAHQGDLEVFADNLPGEPDNVRRSPRGGYWVAFAFGRAQGSPALMDHLAPYPLVRKSVARLLYLLGSTLKYATTLYDWVPLKDVAARIDNGWILYEMVPKYGLIVELDASGKIIRSLHSPSKKIHFISEVLEHDGHLYLGSFRNRFLGRVKA